MQNILILGPIGSGKSTQADLLSQHLGLPHLSGGDLLHYASEADTPEARDIKEKMLKGELVADDVTVRLIEEHLKGNEHKQGTIIDGFPRNVKEAQMFSLPIDKVIYITLPDEEIIKRLTSRGREDDTPEVIQNRLRVYHEETEPLLAFYRSNGNLAEIDGNRTIEDIAKDIQNLFP
jgi:adenylate kinase